MNRSEKCLPGYNHLFTLNFPGTQAGCNCLENMSADIPFERRGKVSAGKCSQVELQARCSDVLPFGAEVITQMGGYTICGRANGTPYRSVVRPNSTN